MKATLLQITIDGAKLYVSGDLGQSKEFYLPDSTEAQLSNFLCQATVKLAKVLSTERPWRPRKDSELREADAVIDILQNALTHVYSDYANTDWQLIRKAQAAASRYKASRKP